jgi:hypothetical protein
LREEKGGWEARYKRGIEARVRQLRGIEARLRRMRDEARRAQASVKWNGGVC